MLLVIPIAVVRMCLHVQFTETTLLIVIRLLLNVRHCLPLGAYNERSITSTQPVTHSKQVSKFIIPKAKIAGMQVAQNETQCKKRTQTLKIAIQHCSKTARANIKHKFLKLGLNNNVTTTTSACIHVHTN